MDIRLLKHGCRRPLAAEVPPAAHDGRRSGRWPGGRILCNGKANAGAPRARSPGGREFYEREVIDEILRVVLRVDDYPAHRQPVCLGSLTHRTDAGPGPYARGISTIDAVGSGEDPGAGDEGAPAECTVVDDEKGLPGVGFRRSGGTADDPRHEGDGGRLR